MSGQYITRPDTRHVPMGVWPHAPEARDLLVPLDLRLGGRYVSAECQMGAHHACPGGLRTETQMPMREFRCRCVADDCDCKPAQEPSR